MVSSEENGNENMKLTAEASGEAARALKGRIWEKLKEMIGGDYLDEDETLVEYVMVLLRNGRRKADAAGELRVFLGDDDSRAFVEWLWDHLSSNLPIYCPPPPPSVPPTSKRGRRDHDSEPDAKANDHDKEKKTKRQKILWDMDKDKDTKMRPTDARDPPRETERDMFPLRSVVTSVLNPAAAAHQYQSDNAKQPHSRRRKPLRQHHPQPSKGDLASRPAVDAPRRLLQSAVRDAVKPMRHLSYATTQPEPQPPSMNRLRSVLSAPSSEFLLGRDEFKQDVKEQEEEQQQEQEHMYSTSPSPRPAQGPRPVIPAPRSSVFDRLGLSRGGAENSHPEFEDKYSSDSASDKDSYEMVEYSVAQDKETEVVSKKVPGAPASRFASKPSKILNISVNVNTWKSPDMVQETHSFSLQNNQVSKAENPEAAVPAMVQNVPTRTQTPVASRSLEDPDCRTLFVSNVHFGATKDALSRHFNKFGAVLKVIILTDVNTGQPTGSAYVEFLQKESTEAALSLNGTSFMSRILKVVRKNPQEAGPIPGPGWGPSRGAHIGSLPTLPIARPPYLMRGRAPVRGGIARSMQWRRGGQPSDASTAAVAVRSFTYTRVPSKAPGQS
ncbi:Polyadenylate-binding protein 2 [Rhynchospora pubera]|uniref:Polyadenylate-binding protein 2 n=1 Tax=Rhynchospora pubera TaxID=906938 RepID=A0AAV8ENP7_9POAL|nr:Polyadenylate-binding protein 2 [Rhynchospora pubera]